MFEDYQDNNCGKKTNTTSQKFTFTDYAIFKIPVIT